MDKFDVALQIRLFQWTILRRSEKGNTDTYKLSSVKLSIM